MSELLLASLGIIGGADSPTAIFVTGSFQPNWTSVAVLALIIATAVWLWHRGRRK